MEEPKASQKQKSLVFRWINEKTGIICFDHARPLINDEPIQRFIARCCIVILMLATVLASIIALYFSQHQTTTSRLFKENYLKRMKAFMEKPEEHLTLNCACHRPVIKWANFTNFYMMTRGQDQTLSLQFVSNDSVDSLCTALGWQDIKPCSVLLENCCGLEFYDSVLQSTDLMDPLSFANTFGRLVQEKCTTQTRYYFLHLATLSLGNSIYKQDQILEEKLSRSLLAMARAYLVNPFNSSDEYFWEAPFVYYSPDFPTLASSRNIAFKMEVNYRSYLEMCNPPYCDEVTSVSTARRIQSSLSQLGGTIAMLLIVVRTGIWPFLMWLRGWKYKLP